MDLKYSLGADVSLKDISLCLVKVNSEQRVTVIATKKIANIMSGFKECLSWLDKRRKDKALPLAICCEATGVYHENFCYFLNAHKLDLSIVLPNKAKKFIESLGVKSKNDPIDARGLATMGAERNLTLWTPMSTFFLELRDLTRQHQKLQEAKTVYSNQLHAIEHAHHQSKLVVRQLKSSIKLIDKQLVQLVKAIEKHIHSNEEVSAKATKICLIKGIGVLTLAIILAETNGFELFENQKQLISYAGYDVVERQSGKFAGKTRISKRGNSRIRRALYFPAFTVVTHKQTSFYNLFLRLAPKHPRKMIAYTAVQKKLLTTIFALWRKDEAYDNDYYQNIQEQEQESPSSSTISALEKGSPVKDRTTQGRHPVNNHSMSPLQVLLK